MAAILSKLAFTDPAVFVPSAFQQGWLPAQWIGTSKPELPAGMILTIQGQPYIVTGGGNLTPSGTPADGLVYIKVYPNPGDAGATALAELTATWSATWSDAFGGWYDGDATFLNFFCTKALALYSAKGYWMDFRDLAASMVQGVLNSGLEGITYELPYTSRTRDAVFTALESYFPNIGEKRKIQGFFYSGGGGYPYNFCTRISATRLGLNSQGSVHNFDQGDASTISNCVYW
jgi:hypothetical protein